MRPRRLSKAEQVRIAKSAGIPQEQLQAALAHLATGGRPTTKTKPKTRKAPK